MNGKSRKRPPRLALSIVSDASPSSTSTSQQHDESVARSNDTPSSGNLKALAKETQSSEEEQWEITSQGDSGSPLGMKRFWMLSRRGKKRAMCEDACSAVPNEMYEHHGKLFAFFGVFDGHGGPHAAQYAAQNLLLNVISCELFDADPISALKVGFTKTDQNFLAHQAARRAAAEAATLRQHVKLTSRRSRDAIQQNMHAELRSVHGRTTPKSDAPLPQQHSSAARAPLPPLARSTGSTLLDIPSVTSTSSQSNQMRHRITPPRVGTSSPVVQAESPASSPSDSVSVLSPRSSKLKHEQKLVEDDIEERMQVQMALKSPRSKFSSKAMSKSSSTSSTLNDLGNEPFVPGSFPSSYSSLGGQTTFSTAGLPSVRGEPSTPSRDKEFGSGSTAVTALIQDDNLFVAHVGDSRAVLSVDGEALQLTDDHRALRDDEAARIEAAGGFVLMGRVDGILAVSRGIGDEKYKKYVIAEPEIHHRQLSASDRFLIIASDGLWDWMPNQDAVNLVEAEVTRAGECNETFDLEVASRSLVSEALLRGSVDDITVLIIDLRVFNNLFEKRKLNADTNNTQH